MQRIGIISDTHSYIDERILEHFKDCDEIWHAGDIGTDKVLEELKKLANLKAVFGNIDGGVLRSSLKEIALFKVEDVSIMLVHIAGPFAKYYPSIKEVIKKNKPNVLVCGHSHILKVAFDHTHKLIYMNPGAAGKHGFHKVRTILKMDIKGNQLKDLKVIELGKR